MSKLTAQQITINKHRRIALFNRLRFEGYIVAEGNEIDAEVCAENVCECGHVGAKYYAFTKRTNVRNYRAVSVCKNCG